MLRAAFAPRRRERRRQRLRLPELDRGGLDRRLAVRAHLPERLERLLAVAARRPQAGGADRADQEGLVDLGPADRTVQVAAREALLHRLDLELALTNVLEVLGRAEEHVDQRADERRHQAEHGRHPDEPRVLDPPTRVLVDPEGRRQPEDRDEEHAQVADHGPRAVAEEVEQSVCCYWGQARLLREGASRRDTRRRTRGRRSSGRRRRQPRRRSGARRTVPWYVLESDDEVG